MEMNLDKKIINLTFQQRNAFKKTYLLKLYKVTPQRFEELIEILLDNMGYQDVGVTKKDRGWRS
jgi:restriction endonuclease Mrr